MKRTIKTAMPMLMIFITLSISAQINSGPGYMHGGNKHQADTATKSVYDSDKMKVEKKNADTTVIRRVPTKASEARAERAKGTTGNGQGATDKPDTSAPVAAPSDQSTSTASRDTITTIGTSTTAIDCDCKSSNLAYGVIGLAVGGLLGLLIGGLLKRKRDDNQGPSKYS